ncbi:YcdB/YcdC domain-containing protein [Brevibacillus migulae]|uniref:YcdB/YcdC domain-containing protein n=1 Tax=Brevibacillus migulae TaxID=1644114 RepID=UPI00106E2A4F|nr:YcdB/YcdC domain-containing protein [Brevibacillus migulae]
MKIWKKAALTAVAVSLLSATPAWAAKPKDHEDRLSNKEAWLKKLEEAQEAKEKALEKGKGKVKAKAIKKLPAEMKQVLQKIIKQLPELKDFEVSSAYINEGDEYQPETWEFELDNGKKGDEAAYADIEVNAETGALSSYRYHTRDEEEGELPDYDDAKKKADDFLAKIMTTDAKKYKVIADVEEEEEEDFEGSRMFIYERFVNGIPLRGAHISIHVDSEGNIVYFRNANPSKIKDSSFPKPNNALSEKEADEKYTDLMDMELLYNKSEIIEYPADDDDDDDDDDRDYKTKPVLKYEPRYAGPMDAAKGGIPKDLDLWEESKNEGKMFSLTPKGEKMYAPNREAAEQLLKNAFGIDMSKFEMYDEDDEEDEIYYNWESNSDDDDREIELGVDAKTGEVIDFYVWHREDAPKPKLSEEQALEYATTFVERFIDTDIKEVQLRNVYLPVETPKFPSWVDKDIIEEIEEEIEPEHTYRFSFYATHQGVAVENDRFSVRVNATTGEIEGFGYNLEDDVDLPDNENVASEKKAAKAYLKAQPLKLMYIYPEFFGYKAPKPILVYESEYTQAGYVDAFTGEFVKVREPKKD